MSSFKGQFRYTLDAKGRLNVPAKIRRRITGDAEETFVIFRGFDPCLFVYPLDEWKKFEEKLRKLTFQKKLNRRFLRSITSQASEDTCDKQGRITIPTELLEIARIKKDVMIIGVLDRFEIWDPEVYEKYLDESDDSYEDMTEMVMFDD